MTRMIVAMLAISCMSGAAAAAEDVAELQALKAGQWTIPELGLKMARIPAGSFVMGSPKNELDRRDDEVQHEVTIGSPFYMGVYEVTQQQYYAIMLPNFDHESWQYARGPIHAGLALFYRERKDRNDYIGGQLRLQNPMECVPWKKAREFCRKVTQREREAKRLPEGYVYRLPTEAEWEYSCRAGSVGPYNVTGEGDGADYVKSADYLGSFANVGEGCPVAVGQREPNAWGLYDMHGNVYEWCLDWYGAYPTGKVKDPTGAATGDKRVARGGCFNGTAPHSPPGVIARADSYSGAGPFLRSASRYRFSPDVDFYAILGFRVVLAKAMATVDEEREAGQPAGDGFVSIFDGKTTDGWHAVPKESSSDWSVRDGVIVGHGSANRLAYLVWQDEHLTDFELELRYRLPGKGNTGVEIRSQPDLTGKRPFEGYHADLGHVGIGPHILGAWDFHFARRKEYPCPRGTRLIIDQDGEAQSSKIPGALTKEDVRQGQWNDVRIVARGNHFQFFVNGKPASEFTDNAKNGRLDQGAIGLQIHDKDMQIEFKDIRLKRLAGSPRGG